MNRPKIIAIATLAIAVPVIAWQHALISKWKRAALENRSGISGFAELVGPERLPLDPTGIDGFEKKARVGSGITETSRGGHTELGSSLNEILTNPDPTTRLRGMLEFIETLDGQEIPDALEDLRANTPDWDPDARVAVQALLTRWGIKDPDAAIAYVDGLKGRQAGGEAALVLAGIASADPSRAVEWLEASENRFLEHPIMERILAGTVAKEWMRQDTDAALAWATTLTKDQQKGAYGGILTMIAARDPHRASQLALQLEPGEARSEVIGDIAESWVKRDPEQALQWAANLKDDVRNRAFGEALGNWAWREPEAAAAYIDNMGGDDELASHHLGRVAGAWARKEPAVAAEWIADKTESEGKNAALEQVMSNWTKSDPEAASQWLLEQPEGMSRDRGIGGLARATFDDDPASAITWAADMSDPKYRNLALSLGVQEWLRREPDQAANWLGESNVLSPAEIEQLISSENPVAKWAEESRRREQNKASK